KWTIKTKTIKTVGLVEAEVNKIVKDLLSAGPATTLGIYVHLGEVDLKITSKAPCLPAGLPTGQAGLPTGQAGRKDGKTAEREIKKLEKKIRKRLGKYIYGVDSESLEYVIGEMLAKNRKTLAIAESCTGGLIANRITNVNGSSKYFKMGIVAYSNEAKVNLLGVSKDKIKKYGAVSKQVALDMAKGVKRLSKADVGLGITGIAGPKGATKRKPIGLVYIAVAGDKIKTVKKCLFIGSREEIKLQASIAALNLIRNTRI
ncbi:MAG: nicotinamide-nucleotide amidohydrolase family protein, partial [Candidatus Omnitrophota bacterium]